MEVISFFQEILQSIAEHVASYRMGQTALRHVDRVLWVVEKCARWAVPPPLDQDERPQPELVRPLPWVFFLMMLIALRVTRESISVINLIMGKPPLRSADVVMYIQSKRRYLRTLKYQGNRIARARSSNTQPRESWYSSLRSLFEFTMCFRKPSLHYGNNNTTSVSNNDEVLVVKHGTAERETNSPVPSGSVETTMERLIEKMMVDLDADSEEDSSFTITTVTTPKSERSDCTFESDPDTLSQIDIISSTIKTIDTSQSNNDINTHNSDNAVASSTPEKRELNAINTPDISKTPKEVDKRYENEKESSNADTSSETKVNSAPGKVIVEAKSEEDRANSSLVDKDDSRNKKSSVIPIKLNDAKSIFSVNNDGDENNASVKQKVSEKVLSLEDSALANTKVSEKPQSENESLEFLKIERSQWKSPRTPKYEHKMVNGRTSKSVPSKKKGGQNERRDTNFVRASAGNNTSL